MKVAVIGTGFMGEVHLATYAAMDGVTIAAVADIDKAKARAAGERYGAAAFDSVEQMLSSVELDAVSVCTSDEHHVEPALAVLDQGLPLLLEKPIATTLDDADAIIRAAESSATVLLVGHVLRFEERYRKAQELVRSGEIGDVVAIFARRLNAASSQERLGGRVSVLSFLGVHDFDICTWIAGSEPVRVYAESRRGYLLSLGYDVEDHVFTTIRYANDVVATVESGWVLPETHPRRADFVLEVIGTHGTINLDLMNLGMSMSGPAGFAFPSFSHGVEGELRHFLACAAGKASPEVSGRAGRSALELSIGASRAARSAMPVTLPL